MPIKPPNFWQTEDSGKVPSLLLQPLSYVYQMGHTLKVHCTKTQQAPLPVICVGNITVGGGGKTPTAIALLKLLEENNISKNPAFLTRGYKAQNKTPRRLQTNESTSDTGDEPQILMKAGMTILSADHYEGTKIAHRHDADIIIMDDGFQNMSVHKDISVLVIDGKTGFGNKKCLPSGPLREPIDSAVSRADAVIIIGDDRLNVLENLPSNLPVFKARIEINKVALAIDKTKPKTAFAGLAHPDKFFQTLKRDGFNVIEEVHFSDHHDFSKKELQNLLKKARANNTTLITTEKDFVRIPEEYQNEIEYIPINLVWGNEEEVLTVLKKKLLSTKNKA